MFPERYVRRFAVGLAVVGFVTPVGLVILGYGVFATLALYACVPLLLAPAIAHVTRNDWRDLRRVDMLSHFDKRLLGTVYLLSLTIALPLAIRSPRPLVFFGLLSLAATLSILYCLQHQAWVAPVAMTGIVVVIFHVSTTLTNAMWLGSGDGAIIWVGVENIVQLNDIVPSAGYDIHPLFFVQAVIISMFGLSTETATFGFGTVVALTGYLFIFLLSRWSNLFPRGYDALPALITPFLYNFQLTATYSIPSTTVALLSILPIALLIAELFGTKDIDRRWRVVLFLSVLSIALTHRFEYVWIVVSAILVLSITAAVTHFADVRFTIREQTVPKFILVVGLVVFLYTFARDSLAPLIVTRITDLFGGVTGSPPPALTEPIGLLITFVSSSFVLVFCLAAVFTVLRRSTPQLLIISGIAILFGIVYFPSPAHMIDLEIFRISRYSIPFIALFTGFGVLTLWNRSTAIRIILVVLLLTSGVFALANDTYTRDNPIMTTGTLTNYLTEQDRHAAEHSFTYNTEIAYERTLDQYHRGRTHAEGWGDVHSDSVHPDNETELCSTLVLTNTDERHRRGQEVYGTVVVTSNEDYAQRNSLYTNGNNILYGPCLS